MQERGSRPGTPAGGGGPVVVLTSRREVGSLAAPVRRKGREGTGREGWRVRGEGGGGRGRGVCARARGEGGRCARPPSVTVWPSVAGARPGLAKVGRGARGAAGDGGAADGDGARTPLGGDESRRASSTGANPGGGGGSATPSPRGRTGPGRAPPEGLRGGGLGWAPGLRGPGPGSAWAGAGETGRALGLRLGGGGAGGLCWLGAESREAPEGGRSLGGGGCSLPGGRRGPLLSEGGGGAGVYRPV